MKVRLILIATISLVVTSQINAQTDDAKKKAFREAVQRGDQIFGGIMLAQKCKTYQQSEYSSFESKAKAIVGVIKKVIGQEKVNIMVQRAKVGVTTKPYSECGEKATKFVNASKEFVEKTYTILATGKPNVNVDLFKKYSGIVTAYSMQQKCKVLPKNISSAFNQNIDIIQKYLVKNGLSDEYIAKIKKYSLEAAEKEPYSLCGSQTINIISLKHNEAIDWSNMIKKLPNSG